MTRWLTEEQVAEHQAKVRGLGVVVGAAPLERPALLRPRKKYYPVRELCHHAGYPEPEAEYVFHPTRKWRFDFAWPAQLIAIEIDGGIWTDGGHNRGKHIRDTHEKLRAAAILGWRILFYDPETLGAAVDDLRALLPKEQRCPAPLNCGNT